MVGESLHWPVGAPAEEIRLRLVGTAVIDAHAAAPKSADCCLPAVNVMSSAGQVQVSVQVPDLSTSFALFKLRWCQKEAGVGFSTNISSIGTSSMNTAMTSPLVKSAVVARRAYSSINCNTPYNVCFVRHGQSTWNRDNRFIGWTDTPLTEDGVLEARVAGRMLQSSGILFDEAHTSLLRRSIRTTNLILMEMGQEYIPVFKHWRLNERSYGDLVGLNKKEVVKKFGKDQVKRWRRSYDEPPPPMNYHHEHHPRFDPRYRLMLDEIPASESLKCTKARSKVYWDDVIAPSLRSGKTLLIVGHENNLRSLIMRLEDIPREEIINLDLPRAVPLAYRLDENLKPIASETGKLDDATGMLRGTWLGGDNAVQEILDRDHKQVYDTTIEHNLEKGTDKDKWRRWTEIAMGKPEGETNDASFL